jgi:hypothetical protein
MILSEIARMNAGWPAVFTSSSAPPGLYSGFAFLDAVVADNILYDYLMITSVSQDG